MDNIQPLSSSSSSSSSLEATELPNKTSVRVLICSANIGNAQPDNASINAWIPSNGQIDLAISRPPKFPVILDPRRAKNPEKPPQEQKEDETPLSTGTGTSNPGTDKGVVAVVGKKKKHRRRDSNTSISNLEDSSSSFVSTTKPERRDSDTQSVHSDYSQWLAQRRHSSSGSQQEQQQPLVDDYSLFIATTVGDDANGGDYEAFLAAQQQQKRNSFTLSNSSGEKIEQDKSKINGGAKENDDDTHNSITVGDNEEDDDIKTASSSINDSSKEEESFRGTRSQFSTSNGSSDDGFGKLVESRLQSSLDNFLESNVPSVISPEQDGPRRTISRLSNASSIHFETNFDTIEAPTTTTATTTTTTTTAATAVEATPPPPSKRDDQDSVASSAQPPPEQFDIIVIGMQEATFTTENSSSKEEKDSSKPQDTTATTTTTSDDGSLSLSGDEMKEMEMDSTGWDSGGSFDFNAIQSPFSPGSDDSQELETLSPRKSRRSTAGKMLGATLKAGKVGLLGAKAGLKAGKAGLIAGKKVGMATVKTAKTVNNLVTAKDHTSRKLPSAQQASAPIMDGGFPGWSDTDVLHYRFEDQLPDYERALSYQLGEMRLLVYYKPTAINLDVLSVKYRPTGAGGLANKGGIVAEVNVNQSTRLSFLTAHLEAHEGEEKYATRCTSFLDILMGTKSSVTPLKYDASQSSHFTFALGDLNFRTRLTGVEPGSKRHIRISHAMAAAKDWKVLNKYDELASALQKKHCLVGFRTPYCNFDPTFKVAREDGYVYNPKRSPSYTDRILFKAGDQLHTALRPILYEPVEKFTTSDHKPIRGAFNIKLNDNISWKQALPLPSEATRSRSSSKSAEESDDEEEPIWQKETVQRETMHIFVSGLQCTINPNEYDKLRKVDKAELPDSYVSFVSTPAEAVQTDSSKKSMWKKFGIGGGSSSSSKGKSEKSGGKSMQTGSNAPPSRFPSTSVIQDTMRPNWKKETLHFNVRTHVSNGDPIDLTGALLHVTLLDAKGMEPRVIGSFALNLARLITVSRNPKLASALSNPRPTPNGGGPPPPPPPPSGGGPGRSAPSRQRSMPQSSRQRSSSSGSRPPPDRQKSSSESNGGGRGLRRGSGGRESSRGIPTRGGPGRGRTPSRGGPGRTTSGGGTTRPPRNHSATGWSISKPSPALQAAASHDDNGFPTPVRKVAKSLSNGSSSQLLPQPMMERRGSLRSLNSGPSLSFRDSIVAADGVTPSERDVDEKLEKMKIVSLRLEEALMECGLEVARIKCCLDVWWTKDEVRREARTSSSDWF